MPRLRHDPKNVAQLVNTRDRLIDAARAEFKATPYSATDTNKIARRAGLSPGTFYNHFASKLDIFREAFLKEGQEEQARVGAACMACKQRGGDLDAIVAVFTDCLIDARREQALLRAQAEILVRSNADMLASEMELRLHAFSFFETYAKELELGCAQREQLSMRLVIAGSLADEISMPSAGQSGLSASAVRAEIRDQVKRCFVSPDS